jgi:hypothetical protein
MITLSGELKQVTSYKTKNGNNIETLHVLHFNGKGFNIDRVTNFTNKKFEEGQIELEVVPKATFSNDRAYLNFTAYEGRNI